MYFPDNNTWVIVARRRHGCAFLEFHCGWRCNLSLCRECLMLFALKISTYVDNDHILVDRFFGTEQNSTWMLLAFWAHAMLLFIY